MKKIILGIVLGVAALIGFATGPSKADSTTVVHQNELATNLADVLANPTKWFFYNDELDVIDNSLGSFVNGPSTPPLGIGSAQISVTGTQRRNLATYQFSGTKLSDITILKFSTYNPSAGNGGNVNRSGYLNFNVTFDGNDTWQKRLVFVPSINGAVSQDSWKEWDTIASGNALWWWSGFAANGNKWPDNNTTEYRTWTDLLAAFPNIAIRTNDSWLGIRVGEPYVDGYTENIDKFVFGISGNTKTFDFEPGIGPTPTPNPFAIPAECSAITGLGSPIIGSNKSEKINGTSGNDLIFALGGADTVDGKGGNDCIVGGSGADKLIGNNGNDVIIGGEGSDQITGDNGTDTLYGNSGSDELSGGSDADTLYGGSDADVLKGDNGADTLNGEGGQDSAKGGNGTDTCVAESKNSCEL